MLQDRQSFALYIRERASLIAYEQIMQLVLLVEWHGFEHHLPQCLIVESFQGNKILYNSWWQTFESRQRCL